MPRSSPAVRHNERTNPGPEERAELNRTPSDSFVLCNEYPSICAHEWEPLDVGGTRLSNRRLQMGNVPSSPNGFRDVPLSDAFVNKEMQDASLTPLGRA